MPSDPKEHRSQAEPDDRIPLPRRAKCLTIWLREGETREEEKIKQAQEEVDPEETKGRQGL